MPSLPKKSSIDFAVANSFCTSSAEGIISWILGRTDFWVVMVSTPKRFTYYRVILVPVYTLFRTLSQIAIGTDYYYRLEIIQADTFRGLVTSAFSGMIALSGMVTTSTMTP